MSTIDWTFGGRWPYAPRYFETDDGRLHYVDEGDGDSVVLLLHGNPTWSYLYRRIIPPLLSAGQRVVCVDHLGFGRSDKPAISELYTIARHHLRLAALLDALDLRQVTLVPHDWSGPIALPWAARNPHRVKRLFIPNTFAPRLPGPMGQRASLRAFRTPGLGSLLVRWRDVPTEQFLFKAGLANPGALDDEDKAAYRAPHPDPQARTAMLVFPRQIPFSDKGPVAELTADIEAGLRQHPQSTRAVLCWGMKDILFGRAVLDRWRAVLPQAEVLELEDAGHFVQEDAPGAFADALMSLVHDQKINA